MGKMHLVRMRWDPEAWRGNLCGALLTIHDPSCGHVAAEEWYRLTKKPRPVMATHDIDVIDMVAALEATEDASTEALIGRAGDLVAALETHDSPSRDLLLQAAAMLVRAAAKARMSHEALEVPRG